MNRRGVAETVAGRSQSEMRKIKFDFGSIA